MNKEISFAKDIYARFRMHTHTSNEAYNCALESIGITITLLRDSGVDSTFFDKVRMELFNLRDKG